MAKTKEGPHGVNEGPTWVSMKDWEGIVFSATGSWTNEYKLWLLPACWRRFWQREIVEERSATAHEDLALGGPFAPGHASFIHSAKEQGRVFCIYHGIEKLDDGWASRKARVVDLGAEHFRPHGADHLLCEAATEPSSPDGPVKVSRTQNAEPKNGMLEKAMGKLRCF